MYRLRFFEFCNGDRRGEFGTHLTDVNSNDIPKKGHLVYLGDCSLLDDGTIYKVKRVVRNYSADERDIVHTKGDALTSIEIEVEPTKVGQ